MAMIPLAAFKTIFITITGAGKRMGYEQTNAENQNQRYAQGFISNQGTYV
jgi:hypothetical protein